MFVVVVVVVIVVVNIIHNNLLIFISVLNNVTSCSADLNINKHDLIL